MIRHTGWARDTMAAVVLSCAALCIPSMSRAQSVGPPAPAIVFVVPRDTGWTMRLVTDAIHSAGYTTAVRSAMFMTTDRRSLTTCDGYTPLVRLSAAVIPAGNGASVVLLWGGEKASATEREEYIVDDHSQAPTGGCAWESLTGIRAAVTTKAAPHVRADSRHP